jgi:hypothetical protein
MVMRTPDPEYQAIVEKWRERCKRNHGDGACGDCIMSMASELYEATQTRKQADGATYFLTRKK